MARSAPPGALKHTGGHQSPPRQFESRPPRKRAGAFLPFLWSSLLFACVGERPNLTLELDLPEGIEPENVSLTLFPFDMDALIDSMALASNPPAPPLSELEDELRRVKPQVPTGVDSLEQEWSFARRNVTHLADSLAAVERTSPGYAAAYGRLRTLYADLAARELTLERRLRDIMSSDQATIAARARDGSEALRRWEAEALAGLGDVVAAKINEVGREPIILRDVFDRRIQRNLEPGRWWAVMRLPHPESPYLEYYWSVPFTTNQLVPVVVPIRTLHASVRWRH